MPRRRRADDEAVDMFGTPRMRQSHLRTRLAEQTTDAPEGVISGLGIGRASLGGISSRQARRSDLGVARLTKLI